MNERRHDGDVGDDGNGVWCKTNLWCVRVCQLGRTGRDATAAGLERRNKLLADNATFFFSCVASLEEGCVCSWCALCVLCVCVLICVFVCVLYVDVCVRR